MFLEKLRSMKYLCDHSNDCFTVDSSRVLKCRECDFQLPLPFFFLHKVSAIYSFYLAEKYAEWTGDCTIPCKIFMHPFSNILNIAVATTNFETITTSARLLKILHQPLKKEAPTLPNPEDFFFFQDTVSSELDAAIDRSSDEDLLPRNIGTIVRTVLVLLKTHFQSVQYFHVVVPHLKKVHRRLKYFQVLDDREDESSWSVTRTFQKRLKDAGGIHLYLSPTCAAFDAVQIAVLCYVLRHEPLAVFDLVLDFAFRFCRGYHDDSFSAPVRDSFLSFEKRMLDSYVSLESNTKIHRLLERFRMGDLADSFSDEFFKFYWQLKAELSMEIDYEYPRAFFRDYAEYYAFWAALAHYAAETDAASKNINEILMGIVVAPPGVLTRCKEIYRFVRRALSKMKKAHEIAVVANVQEFYKNLDIDDAVLFEEDREMKPLFVWSCEIMRLFLEFDPDFAKEVLEATEWLPKLPLQANNEPDLKPITVEKLRKIGRWWPIQRDESQQNLQRDKSQQNLQREKTDIPKPLRRSKRIHNLLLIEPTLNTKI